MEDKFFEAWITRRWKVCGRKLQPLCLGHVVNLEAIGSPLTPYSSIDGNTPVTSGDLLLAVKICSETFPHSARLKPTIWDIARRLALETSSRLFKWHAMLFAAYIRDHCSSPEFWSDNNSGGREISAPLALSKAAYLLANSTLSEERVWSMPLGRVDYLIAAIEERISGTVRFLKEGELELALPPAEEVMTEEEIIEQAQRDLSPGAFAAWLEARKQWRAKAA